MRESAEEQSDKSVLFKWLRLYFTNNTFEISCPAIRDELLAPPGKTGLIISTLFDYPLAKYIAARGWYDEFKEFSAKCMIEILDETIFPGMKDRVIDQFISSPLTLEKLTGNTDGAITGWSFTNRSIPVIHSMPKVARSVETPIPDVFQAGQWVFSPSGLPISILTGKLAADKVIKQLK
jgi:phytoene dehydrogenase-like protein